MTETPPSLDVIAGGCRCGSVRYTLSRNTLPLTYACHCLDCQTWTGSAFSQQCLVPEDTFTVTGELALFELPGSEGKISYQRICPTCHTRVFNTNSARPGVVAIRAGTFDQSHELECVAHIWTARKQAWLMIPEGVPSWSRAAPATELLRALRT